MGGMFSLNNPYSIYGAGYGQPEATNPEGSSAQQRDALYQSMKQTGGTPTPDPRTVSGAGYGQPTKALNGFSFQQADAAFAGQGGVSPGRSALIGGRAPQSNNNNDPSFFTPGFDGGVRGLSNATAYNGGVDMPPQTDSPGYNKADWIASSSGNGYSPFPTGKINPGDWAPGGSIPVTPQIATPGVLAPTQPTAPQTSQAYGQNTSMPPQGFQAPQNIGRSGFIGAGNLQPITANNPGSTWDSKGKPVDPSRWWNSNIAPGGPMSDEQLQHLDDYYMGQH